MAKLEEVEANLGESSELVSARQWVEACRSRIKEITSRQKDVDFLAEEVRIKATDIEKKLYGGTLRNPKELEDYEADLTSLKTQLGSREDDLLEVMMELDAAENNLRAAERELSRIEDAWHSDQASLKEQKAELTAELETLRERREHQVDRMGAAQLGLYTTIRERRGGVAVAVVERGLCQGCRITLPMSVLAKARSGVSLVQCVSCERILLVN